MHKKSLAESREAFLVRQIGLEPTRRKTLDPKSSASANSATSAFSGAKVQIKN